MDALVAMQVKRQARGGCPLGSLAGQLAEHDPGARAALAEGLGRLGGPRRGPGWRRCRSTASGTYEARPGRSPGDDGADARGGCCSRRSDATPGSCAPRSTRRCPAHAQTPPERAVGEQWYEALTARLRKDGEPQLGSPSRNDSAAPAQNNQLGLDGHNMSEQLKPAGHITLCARSAVPFERFLAKWLDVLSGRTLNG